MGTPVNFASCLTCQDLCHGPAGELRNVSQYLKHACSFTPSAVTETFAQFCTACGRTFGADLFCEAVERVNASSNPAQEFENITIIEPLSFWSNLSYIIAVIIILITMVTAWARNRNKARALQCLPPNLWLAVGALFTIGIGSMLFHAFETLTTSMLDVVPILFMGAFVTHHVALRLARDPRVRSSNACCKGDISRIAVSVVAFLFPGYFSFCVLLKYAVAATPSYLAAWVIYVLLLLIYLGLMGNATCKPRSRCCDCACTLLCFGKRDGNRLSSAAAANSSKRTRLSSSGPTTTTTTVTTISVHSSTPEATTGGAGQAGRKDAQLSRGPMLCPRWPLWQCHSRAGRSASGPAVYRTCGPVAPVADADDHALIACMFALVLFSIALWTQSSSQFAAPNPCTAPVYRHMLWHLLSGTSLYYALIVSIMLMDPQAEANSKRDRGPNELVVYWVLCVFPLAWWLDGKPLRSIDARQPHLELSTVHDA